MSFKTTVLQVLLGSPNDVDIQVPIDAINEWNATNSETEGVVLLPMHYKICSVPEMAKRPQERFNEQVVNQCDFMIAIFRHRTGSDAGKGLTGTFEEIKIVIDSGKKVLFYISKEAIPRDANLEQVGQLNKFVEENKRTCTYYDYANSDDLSKALLRNLTQIVRETKQDFIKKKEAPEITVSEIDVDNNPAKINEAGNEILWKHVDDTFIHFSTNKRMFRLTITPLCRSKNLISLSNDEVLSFFLNPLLVHGHHCMIKAIPPFNYPTAISFDNGNKETYHIILYKNGHFEFWCNIDSSFIEIGINGMPHRPLGLDPMNVAHYPLHFLHIAKLLYSKLEIKSKYQWGMWYTNINGICLYPGEGRRHWHPAMPNPVPYQGKNFVHKMSLLKDFNADECAYDMIKSFYEAFGREGSNIPYFKDGKYVSR